MNKIIPIPAFKDNYIWLFSDEISHEAWIVDPGNAEPVIQTLNKLNLSLKGILITHHHQDHTGGINRLMQTWDHVEVVGSHHSPIHSITHRVKEDDVISCASRKLSVTEIPGHTLDHIAFYNEDVLFCGDTLFSFGCGRVFEGTPEQMYHSLQKLAVLSPATQMFCGHEYTLANLAFAQQVEPHNLSITNKIQETKNLRQINHPTLPSTIAIEKQLNPFLRCTDPAVVQAAESYCQKKLTDPVEVFAHLRAWKNAY